MSERQAKIKRKGKNNQVEKKSVDKQKVIFYIISFIVIAVFVFLATKEISAILQKKNQQAQTNAPVTETTEPTPDTSTLGGLAESKGLTFEDFALQAGLDTTMYTADMPVDVARETFTLANGTMVDYSIPYEEFAEQYKLDTATIPADMLYKDAVELFTIETRTLLDRNISYEEFATNNEIDTAKIPATMLYKDAVELFTVGNVALMDYGVPYDEFVTTYGIDSEMIKKDMPYQEATSLFTLANVAAFSQIDVEEFKTQAGLPADVDTTVPMKELPTSVMMTFNGITASIEDLKTQGGLAADITEDTKWGDAEEAIAEAYKIYTEAQSNETVNQVESEDITSDEATNGGVE